MHRAKRNSSGDDEAKTRARARAHPWLSKRGREINQDLFFRPPRREVRGPRSGSRGKERGSCREREREGEGEKAGIGRAVVEEKSGKGSCGCESVLSRGETINFAGIHVDRGEDEPTSTIDGLCWPPVSHPRPSVHHPTARRFSSLSPSSLLHTVSPAPRCRWP